VTLNAAAALVAYAAAGGELDFQVPDARTDLGERMAVALPAARAALDSGAAAQLLDRWITTSQDLQP
jgi:anthranilate phosphoribosyltransferase